MRVVRTPCVFLRLDKPLVLTTNTPAESGNSCRVTMPNSRRSRRIINGEASKNEIPRFARTAELHWILGNDARVAESLRRLSARSRYSGAAQSLESA